MHKIVLTDSDYIVFHQDAILIPRKYQDVIKELDFLINMLGPETAVKYSNLLLNCQVFRDLLNLIINKDQAITKIFFDMLNIGYTPLDSLEAMLFFIHSEADCTCNLDYPREFWAFEYDGPRKVVMNLLEFQN